MSTNPETWARQLLAGEISVDQFSAELRATQAAAAATVQTAGQALAGIADTGAAQIDLDRARRCGFPEVVYSPGKTPAAMEAIFHALLAAGSEVLATRVSPEQTEYLLPLFPQAFHNEAGRILRVPPEGARLNERAEDDPRGKIVVVTAGTGDLPVAEEVRETALWMGCATDLIVDVGVAGPHRLPRHLARLTGADAIVVVAGMEGALPSVVGGYVDCPVIGVPTSVGYGASLGGAAALLSMLNSCAANVTVVNIDAGFKAGYIAGLIASRVQARAEG